MHPRWSLRQVGDIPVIRTCFRRTQPIWSCSISLRSHCVLNVMSLGTAIAHRSLAATLRRTVLPAVVAVDAAVLALWSSIATAAQSVIHEQPEYQAHDLWVAASSWLLPAARILLIGVVSICMLCAVIQALFTTAELLHDWLLRDRRARDQLTATSHEAMG